MIIITIIITIIIIIIINTDDNNNNNDNNDNNNRRMTNYEKIQISNGHAVRTNGSILGNSAGYVVNCIQNAV